MVHGGVGLSSSGMMVGVVTIYGVYTLSHG